MGSWRSERCVNCVIILDSWSGADLNYYGPVDQSRGFVFRPRVRFALFIYIR